MTDTEPRYRIREFCFSEPIFHIAHDDFDVLCGAVADGWPWSDSPGSVCVVCRDLAAVT